MVLRRWAPAFAGAAVRAPCNALTRGGPGPAPVRRVAAAAPSAARSLVTAPPRWAAAVAGDILPGLPGDVAERGEGVAWLYDRYAAEGAAGGIVDFGSTLSYTKQREEPLPEVRMSHHSKHALHISRHKLNDICRTVRGLSVHVSQPAIRCDHAACALRVSSPSWVGVGGGAGGGRPALLLTKASGDCGVGPARQNGPSCQGPRP